MRGSSYQGAEGRGRGKIRTGARAGPAAPAPIARWLTGEVVTLAWCWWIARQDGVVLGFTSHDRDMERDGTLYRAAPGMVPGAISLSGTLDADSVDIKGALTADALSESDFDLGRWDGARLWLYACDWEDAAAVPILVAEGELGAIDRHQRGFSAELRGIAAALDVPVVPATSSGCRAALGDRACRVDMSRHRGRAVVEKAEGRRLYLTPADPRHMFGMVRFIDGPLAGIDAPILSAGPGWIELVAPPARPVAAGTRVRLAEGCDKRFSTCRERFGNAVNFRGEPHLPGMDYLTRYPGG